MSGSDRVNQATGPIGPNRGMIRPPYMNGRNHNDPGCLSAQTKRRNNRGTSNHNTVEPSQRRLDSCPFEYWSHYFQNENYDPNNENSEMVTKFSKMLTEYFSKFPDALESVGGRETISINYEDILELEYGEYTATMLDSKPADVLKCLSLASTEILKDITLPNDAGIDKMATMHTIRLYNYGNEIRIKNLRSHSVGRLVTFKGTIVRVSSPTPLIKSIFFICELCSFKWKENFIDGNYIKPTICPTNYCRSKFITCSLRASDVETVEYQQIRIQEKLADKRNDAGKIPRNVICELMGDLIDSAIPGDVVSVTGVVKPLLWKEDKTYKIAANRVYHLLIDVNNITKIVSRDENIYKCDDYARKDYCDFSKRDLYGIQEVFHSENVFKLLVHSFCPSIYGHELVKAGILLSLFGGRRKTRDSRHEPDIRSDIHLLVVGDPGLGKSQMLSAARKLSPRGVFVSGNTSTTTGLTVTVLKDKDSGELALEAGALVLSDQGICCIDEFDKMTEHAALLEVMEQQSVSVAKSGIVCTLPAMTSIIAAANPVGGHYDKSKSVSENIKIDPAILSRFDLIYIILDNPDTDFDSFLSHHVAQLHSEESKTAALKRVTKEDFINMSSQKTPLPSSGDDPQKLRNYLKLKRGETIDSIPHQILSKYILYARTYVHPIMSDEAAKFLKETYVEMRKNYHVQNSTPVTTRRLESLIRLSEARARSELREGINIQDAKDAKELILHGTWETFTDPYGNTEVNKAQPGGKQSEIRRYITHLHTISSKTGNNFYSMSDLERIAMEMRVSIKPIQNLIYLLNSQGYIIHKGNKIYQITTL